MAAFAPVAPIHILEALDTFHMLGRYHLLLAHDVAGHSVERRERYGHLFSRGQNGQTRTYDTVIMDNSVAEQASGNAAAGALPLGMILDAIVTTRANVVVLPDVYCKGPETYDSTMHALPEWHLTIMKRMTGFRWSFMVVPQGRDWIEWVTCAERLAFPEDPTKANIGWWGVPRNLVEHCGVDRYRAVRLLKALNPHRKIHMLGFSTDMVEDITTARWAGVDGIDSAVPLRVPGKFSLVDDPGKRGDWWEHGELSQTARENLTAVRHMVRD